MGASIRIIASTHGQGAMRALLVFAFAVFSGVAAAFAGDYVDPDLEGPAQDEFESIPDFGGPAEPSQAAPAEAPPRTAPSPWPCHFGPITMRISLDDVEAIIMATATRREAWNAILAREDDPEAEEITFRLAASDDGLGDGLACPEEYVDADLEGPAESAPAEAPPAEPPSPDPRDRPCQFGPFTMQIDPVEMVRIAEAAPSGREALERILALEENPELPPFTFLVATEDDGGEDITCE